MPGEFRNRDAWLQAESDKLWHRHQSRGRAGLPYTRIDIPCLGQPKPGDQPHDARAWLFWALLKVEVGLAGAAKGTNPTAVRPRRTNGGPALLGSRFSELQQRTGELPPKPPPEWRRDYAEDLDDMPTLHYLLSASPPRTSKAIELIAKQARLGVWHKRVLKLWLEGSDVPAIAAETHRRRPTIQQLLDEVHSRLCALGGHLSEQCRHAALEQAS